MDIQKITASLADTMRKHQRVALLYSGGKESSLLLHLLEPWRHQVTVYTLRTEADFPHMVAFVDRKLADWNHVILTRDLGASFVELGFPSSVVPLEHNPASTATLLTPELAPRIVPWNVCCRRNRSVELSDIKDASISAVINGIRAGDYAVPLVAPQGDALELVFPLWSLSRDDVYALVADLEIELPDHYASLSNPDSLECAVCPAFLSSHRRAWMSEKYPEHLAVANRIHGEISKAVLAGLNADNTRLGRVRA